MPRGLDGKRLATAWRHRNVKITRLGRDAVHGAAFAPELPANTAHPVPVVIADVGNLRCRNVLISRRCHLEPRWEVGPQLEAVHPAARVSLRHLLVEDAASGRHPLDVSGPEAPAVAQTVAVINRAGQHIRDGLNAAMRVPWKSGAVVLGTIVAEVVQQKERVEIAGVAEAKGTVEFHPRSLDGWRGRYDPLHRPNRHRIIFLKNRTVANVDMKARFVQPQQCGHSRRAGRPLGPRASRPHRPWQPAPGLPWWKCGRDARRPRGAPPIRSILQT